MTDAHRQADSQSRGTLQVVTLVVTGGKHSEDQLKGDEEFYHQGIPHRNALVYLDHKENSGWYYHILITPRSLMGMSQEIMHDWD